MEYDPGAIALNWGDMNLNNFIHRTGTHGFSTDKSLGFPKIFLHPIQQIHLSLSVQRDIINFIFRIFLLVFKGLLLFACGFLSSGNICTIIDFFAPQYKERLISWDLRYLATLHQFVTDNTNGMQGRREKSWVLS